MTQPWWAGSALLLTVSALLLPLPGAAAPNTAQLIFAGPEAQAVVSVSPADPSAPPEPSQPPEPEPEPELPSCPAGQRWVEGSGCVNPCSRFGRGVSYHPTLDACLVGTSTDNELATRSCEYAGGTPSHQIRQRSRPLYTVYLLDGTRTEIVGPWSEWSAWGACLPPYV